MVCLPSPQGVCQEVDSAQPVREGLLSAPDSAALPDVPLRANAWAEEKSVLKWLAAGEVRFQNLLEAATSKRSSGAKRFVFSKTIRPFSVQDVVQQVMEHNPTVAMQPHQVNMAKQNLLATEAALNPELNLSVRYNRSKGRDRSAVITRLRTPTPTWATNAIQPGDVGKSYPVVGSSQPKTVQSTDVGKKWSDLPGFDTSGLDFCVLDDGVNITSGSTCGADILGTFEEFSSRKFDWSPYWSGNLGIYQPFPWGGAVNVGINTTYLPYDTPQPVPLKPMGAPLETALAVGDQEWASTLSVGLNMPLPYTKNFGSEGFGTAVQIKQASFDYEKSQSAQAAQVNQTLKDAIGAYWSLVRSQLTVLSAVEQRNLLEQRMEQVQRLYQVQRVTEYDRVQTETDLEDARNQEEIAWNSWVARANELAEQLNLTPELLVIPHGYRDELAADVIPDDQSVAQTALEHRTEIRSAQIDVQKAELEKNYRAQQLLPDVAFSASYNALGKGSAALFGYDSFGSSISALATPDERNYLVGLVYTIPFENRAEKARHAMANSARTQAMDRASLMEMQVARDVTNGLAKAHGSEERVKMARAAVRLADEALRTAERLRVMERVTEFELLQRQRSLFEARADLIEALTERRQSWVDLQFAQGLLGNAAVLSVEAKP